MHKIIGNKVFRYLLAGGSAFAVEYAAFYVLLNVVATHLIVATSLSFGFGLLTSFLANRHWTFSEGDYKRGAKHQLAFYAALALANLVIVNILVTAFESIGIDPKIGKLITMVMLPIWNYFIFKKIIFSVKTND